MVSGCTSPISTNNWSSYGHRIYNSNSCLYLFWISSSNILYRNIFSRRSYCNWIFFPTIIYWFIFWNNLYIYCCSNRLKWIRFFKFFFI